jgi:hypothetical protein
MAQFHETYDVWLGATLGTPPLKLGMIDIDERNIAARASTPMMDYVPFTAMQNATGQPAINLPLQLERDGLPLGVQFVARYGDEMTLLQLAAELETARPGRIAQTPTLEGLTTMAFAEYDRYDAPGLAHLVRRARCRRSNLSTPASRASSAQSHAQRRRLQGL